nr:phage antirepressor KilAC domain-containing protein [Aneurinibacillus tyrosinisolvens]
MSIKTKFLSTTALSKEIKMAGKDLFNLLQENGWIERKDDTWVLTQKGIDKGGITKTDTKIGSWIAWPEEIKNESLFNKKEEETKLLNATYLAQKFNISKFRLNPILSELGWIERERKGWILTKLGQSVGGKQFEHEKTGIPFVCWPQNILENKRLLETFKEVQGENQEEKIEETVGEVGFREKFEAKLRTADGHYVRSKAEMLIDNWLYMSEIVHAYERKLPVEEDVYCDFYLPVGKVYIEYWGLENDEKYANRKDKKIQIYNKYGFNLIELNDTDIQNLDDVLPRKLLKFGIQAY